MAGPSPLSVLFYYPNLIGESSGGQKKEEPIGPNWHDSVWQTSCVSVLAFRSASPPQRRGTLSLLFLAGLVLLPNSPFTLFCVTTFTDARTLPSASSDRCASWLYLASPNPYIIALRHDDCAVYDFLQSLQCAYVRPLTGRPAQSIIECSVQVHKRGGQPAVLDYCRRSPSGTLLAHYIDSTLGAWVQKVSPLTNPLLPADPRVRGSRKKSLDRHNVERRAP